MMSIRPVELPNDRAAILALDTAFTTDLIYDVRARPSGFTLEERQLTTAVRKAFDLADELADDRLWEYGLVAEDQTAIVSFAAIRSEHWNRRAQLWHLYVAPSHRGAGLGKRLLNEACAYARTTNARCLWLEASSFNYPAIQFYRAVGFRLCGLDQTLYTPEDAPGETALYFARDLHASVS